MIASKARGLRWERRPAERPHELLDAALRVFAERGYRCTRLDEVAAAAGVTKGALYHYFSNKEELLLRALEQHQARAFGRIEEALRGATGPASVRIRLLVRRGFGGDDDARRDVLRLLQQVAHEVPEVYRRWLANGPARAWELVAALIEEGKRTGEFRPDADGEVAARLLVSGLMSQLVWQSYAGAVPALAIDRDRLCDSAVELVLAGLRPVGAGSAARRRGR